MFTAVAVSFRFPFGSAPSVSTECRALTDSRVLLEVRVSGRSASGFLEVIAGAAVGVAVTADDSELAEVVARGDGQWEVRTRGTGKTTLRARHGALEGRMSLEILPAGPVRMLWPQLDPDQPRRVGVYAEDAANGCGRWATAALGLTWKTIAGDLFIDDAGEVSGAGVLEARVGSAWQRLAAERRDGVVRLMTSSQFSGPWMAGVSSIVSPTVARSDGAAPSEARTLQCSDERVARVHGNRLHPRAAGTATVTMGWDGLTLDCELRVEAAPITYLHLRTNVQTLGNDLVIPIGTNCDFSVVGRGAANEWWDLDLLDYVELSISSPAVEVVLEDGFWRLHARQSGVADIVARCAGREETLHVSVYDPADVEINW